MFGSDRSRPQDYRRAVVIDTGPKKYHPRKTLFGVGGGVRFKNDLTGPALLEMSGNATTQELAWRGWLRSA